MLRPVRFILMILLTSFFVLSSCTASPKTFRILTDRTELAQALEIYDSAHPEIIMVLSYADDISSSVIESENPDLVIGSNLSAEEFTRLFHPYKDETLLKGTYPELRGPLNSRLKPYLLPISFQLPLIMGGNAAMNSLPDPSTVSPEELREIAAEFNGTDEEGRLIRMGFSPTWDPRTFIDLLAVHSPYALEQDPEHLSEELLASVMQEARNWIIQAAGTAEADRAFNTRYRYIPDETLILDGRILFARTDFASWASLPDSISERLDIKYLRGERSIPVISLVSAGILSSSRNKSDAEAFLAWLCGAETQKLMMDRWEREGITVFGFFGGLSAVPEVNESALIDRYPRMKGMIPEGHNLASPERFPHRWNRIRDEVMAPWFVETAALPEGGLSFADAYRRWDLSSLDEAD